jgi:predicted nucleotidyltransferase
VDSKLVLSTLTGRLKHYRANAAAPVFDELRAIVEKTAGVPDQLRRALAPVADRLQLAVLFGSVAKEADTANSDIDVLLVSDELALDDVFAALERAEQRLGRRVSPTLYTSKEFHRRRRTNQPFLTRVLGGKHIILIGSEDAVAAA